jgi:quaternary ammonium compound-resistance protein SugE
MAWVVLVFSGIMEAGWALSLKASDGFTRLWPTVAFSC